MDSDTMMIKNIIFDMGGVLLPLNPARAIAAFEKIGAKRTAQYIHEFRTEDMFLDIEMGTMTMAQFCDAVRQKDGITVPDSAILSAWNNLLEPMDNEHRNAIMRLQCSGRYRLFILSNTCPLHWQYASTQLIPTKGQTINTFFERCFLSYEMHCRKPAKDIFLTMAQQAVITPDATIFIDDNESNILAAQAIGFRTFYEQPSHHWADHLTLQLV